jgi:hypothetical protein
MTEKLNGSVDPGYISKDTRKDKEAGGQSARVYMECSKASKLPVEIRPVSFHCSLLIRAAGVVVIHIDRKLIPSDRFYLVNGNRVRFQGLVSHNAGRFSSIFLRIAKNVERQGKWGHVNVWVESDIIPLLQSPRRYTAIYSPKDKLGLSPLPGELSPILAFKVTTHHVQATSCAWEMM